jgi:VanZ family protein
MPQFLKYWLPVIVWAGFIFSLSAQPGLSSGFPWPYDFVLRKGAHVFVFAILFLLMIRALKNYGLSNNKALLCAFIFTILYAVSDEYHQTFVSQRVGSPSDVAIDSLGVVFLTLWQIRKQPYDWSRKGKQKGRSHF